MSRRRQLSDEERTLWKTYARSIKPLRGAAKTAEPDIEEAKAPVKMPAKPHAAYLAAAAPRETRRRQSCRHLRRSTGEPSNASRAAAIRSKRVLIFMA